MKAFQPLDEIQFELIHLVNYYSRKPSFKLKIVQTPFLFLFCEFRMATMVEVFDSAMVKKKNFFVNFQRSEFVCFWSVSRESVKELIYQKKLKKLKNGGHQAFKRVISM